MGESDVLRQLSTQGPWALLFCVLLFWVMREATKREKVLMDFITGMRCGLQAISDNLIKLSERIEALCDIMNRRKE